MLSAVLCLNGAVQICLCDPDPDGCGADCHECTPETEDSCSHLTLRLDAPVVTPSDVTIPVTAINIPDFPYAARAAAPAPALPVPPSTAPPDTGGRYLLKSTRLYPRT